MSSETHLSFHSYFSQTNVARHYSLVCVLSRDWCYRGGSTAFLLSRLRGLSDRFILFNWLSGDAATV